MEHPKINQLQIAVGNLSAYPELRPENMKSLFKKLDTAINGFDNIEKSISQARQSINSLLDSRSKTQGSIDTLISIIGEQMPQELIDKYGKEIISDGREVAADNKDA